MSDTIEAGTGTGKVRIEGLATLARTMRKAGEDLTDLKDANQRAGSIVAAAAATTAPRRTGRLAASLRSPRVAGRATVQSRLPYGPPIAWGWPARNIKAQPFLSDAARATEPQWLPQYIKDLEKALDRVQGA